MFPCEIKQQAAQPALTMRFRAPVQELPQHFGKVYGAIIGYLEERGEQHAGAAFAMYHNMDMQNLDMEAGFTVTRPVPGKDEIHASTIPGGTFAVCHYTGPYDACGPAYEELAAFIDKQGYKVSGACYEFYFSGPEVAPKDTKTDLVYQVTSVSEHEPA